MPIEFETKKIATETLGEYLSEVRADLGLTLEEVSQKTGIYEKFIYYIEAGKYHELPPGVYVLGFLKKLASIYHISAETLIEQYRKERGIVEHAVTSEVTETSSFKDRLKQITITPKLLTITGSIAVVLIAFFYVVIQVFAINKTPELTIVEPKNDAVIAGTTVNVVGLTEPGIVVAINGQNVFVDPDGKFQTTIGVAPGQKELAIEAQNKFGKRNQQNLALRVEEQAVAGVETQVPSELQLELKFRKATKIEVTKDGIEIPVEIVPAGGIKQIVAEREVVLTTYDAGSTQVMINGENIGVLGKNGEKLTIPLTVDSAALFDNSETETSD